MATNMLHLRPQKIHTIRCLTKSGSRGMDAFRSSGFPSLSNAISDLPDTGGTIFASLGTHYLRALCTVAKPGVQIVGAGPGTIFKATGAFGGLRFYLLTTGLLHEVVRDCSMDGDGVGTYGVLFDVGTQSSVIDNVQFSGWTSTGAYISGAGARGNRVQSSHFTTSPIGVAVSACQGELISDCRFVSPTIAGVVIENACRNIKVRDSNFYQGDKGVWAKDRYQYSVHGCHFDTQTTCGIQLGGGATAVEQAHVDDCEYLNGVVGIMMVGCNRSVIGPANYADGVTNLFTIDANSYFNIIWNLSGAAYVDAGVQNKVFATGLDTLKLNAGGFSVGNPAGERLTMSHDGSSGYLTSGVGMYLRNSTTTRCLHIDNTDLTVTGELNFAEANLTGLKIRTKATTGAPDDATYGSNVGMMVWNSVDSDLYIRGTAGWVKVALA